MYIFTSIRKQIYNNLRKDRSSDATWPIKIFHFYIFIVTLVSKLWIYFCIMFADDVVSLKPAEYSQKKFKAMWAEYISPHIQVVYNRRIRIQWEFDNARSRKKKKWHILVESFFYNKRYNFKSFHSRQYSVIHPFLLLLFYQIELVNL